MKALVTHMALIKLSKSQKKTTYTGERDLWGRSECVKVDGVLRRWISGRLLNEADTKH